MSTSRVKRGRPQNWTAKPPIRAWRWPRAARTSWVCQAAWSCGVIDPAGRRCPGASGARSGAQGPPQAPGAFDTRSGTGLRTPTKLTRRSIRGACGPVLPGPVAPRGRVHGGNGSSLPFEQPWKGVRPARDDPSNPSRVASLQPEARTRKQHAVRPRRPLAHATPAAPSLSGPPRRPPIRPPPVRSVTPARCAIALTAPDRTPCSAGSTPSCGNPNTFNSASR